MSDYYAVKYGGEFAFIKPAQAVRDSETYSQQFLTPSIVEGIERKLFPETDTPDNRGQILKIAGHRLSFTEMSNQQERTIAKAPSNKKYSGVKYAEYATGILVRYVLLSPELYLIFRYEVDAARAAEQHICLCRNEDLLFPQDMTALTADELESDKLPGFELKFGQETASFWVGHNRYRNGEAMHGSLRIYGNPNRATL